MQPRLYFLHIPKTSGTSVRMYLEGQYRTSEVLPVRSWDELLAMDEEERSRYRLIRGHFGASLGHVFAEPPQIVTVVRDPFAQAVSHWAYVMLNPSHSLYATMVAAGGDFAAYMSARPPNLVSRILADDGYRGEGRWRMTESKPAPDDLAERAIARLESCAAFGLADRLADSLAVIAHHFGWTPPTFVPRLNARRGPSYEPSMAERSRFDSTNVIDQFVYDHAVDMFNRRHLLVSGADPIRRYDDRLNHESVPLTAAMTVDFGDHLRGSGWTSPSDTSRGAVRWMAEPTCTVDVPVTLTRFATIEVLCLASMHPDLLAGLELSINGESVSVVWRPTDDGIVVTGVVPLAAVTPGYTHITLRIAHTVRRQIVDAPTDFGVGLGIAISSIRLAPVRTVRGSRADIDAAGAGRRTPAVHREARAPDVSGEAAERSSPTAVIPRNPATGPPPSSTVHGHRAGRPWSVPSELASRVEELDLLDNVTELRRDGYTVIRDAFDTPTVDRIRAAIVGNARPTPVGASGTRSSTGETHMLYGVDPVFVDVLCSPVLGTMADVVCGKGMLALFQGSVRDASCSPIALHAENAGWLPAPYPEHEFVLLSILACDDFDEAGGGTRFVPGSQLARRDPTEDEAVRWDTSVAVEAPRGSLVVWLGTTWHGTHQRRLPGERVALHTLFTRPALRPMFDVRWINDADIPAELRARLGRADVYDQPAYHRPPGAVTARSQAWNRGLGDVELGVGPHMPAF